MKPIFQRVVLASVLGLGLVVSAAAQDRGPGPNGPRGGDRQAQYQDMQHRREQRLHDLLQIKPEQESAFRAFTSSLEQQRPQDARAGGRREGPQAQPRESLTTPQRLDRQLQRLAEAQARLQKQAAAVKTFYAALPAEQRKVLDEFPVVGLGRGRGGERGFGGRGGFMRGRFEGPRFR